MSHSDYADILSKHYGLSKDESFHLKSIAKKLDAYEPSIITSSGEVVSPGLVKRKRVYADLGCYVGSMTKQEFAVDCDINNIVKNFMKTGELPISKRMPHYGDFTQVESFQESLHIVIRAQEQFDSLPAEVRKRFSNDPAEFLKFINDPRNNEEAVKLGLADKVLPEPESDTVKLNKSISELNKTISESSSSKK